MADQLTSSARPSPSFWNGKRVLLTGHTGFKGAWLAFWLSELGAKVSGVSLPPATEPNLCTLLGFDHLASSDYIDIRDVSKLKPNFAKTQPDIVLHLAAQALVRTSYASPLETFATNIMGTAHVLEALRGLTSVRAAVMVTTDKVYRNLERAIAYQETDALGGYDPYSASKAGSELVVSSYRDAFLAELGVAVATARAGNVIGGGDWSADRLLPDAVRAWTAGRPLPVRRPDAVRPWQHVLEPLCGYLVLAERLWDAPHLADAYNFGPAVEEATTVRTAIELAQSCWTGAQVAFGDGTDGPHEAGLLILDASKARKALGVVPQWNLSEAIRRTIRWYYQLTQNASAADLCKADLMDYVGAPTSTA